jgi:hypothetical protein
MSGVKVSLYASPRHTGRRMPLLFKIILGLVVASALVWFVFWFAVALVYLIVTIVECIAKLLR